MLTPEQIADKLTAYPGTYWIDYSVYSPNKEQVRDLIIDAVKLARQDREGGLDNSGLVDGVKAARAAAEGDSNDREIAALNDALDAALSLLGMPHMHHDLYEPEEEED